MLMLCKHPKAARILSTDGLLIPVSHSEHDSRGSAGNDYATNDYLTGDATGGSRWGRRRTGNHTVFRILYDLGGANQFSRAGRGTSGRFFNPGYRNIVPGFFRSSSSFEFHLHASCGIGQNIVPVDLLETTRERCQARRGCAVLWFELQGPSCRYPGH